VPIKIIYGAPDLVAATFRQRPIWWPKNFEIFFNHFELKVVSLALISPKDAFYTGSDVFAAHILGTDGF
jgi:hypothetical protein